MEKCGFVVHKVGYAGVIDTDYLDHRIETSIELRSKTLSRKEKDRIIRKAQMDRYSSGHIFSNPTLRNLDYIWYVLYSAISNMLYTRPPNLNAFLTLPYPKVDAARH
jgi:hypothetical protein